ncbi:MAG: NUDIX hydrolase [Thermoguttaceae bacterium]|jgi:ADP-ribose pyrophosphatase
MNNETERRILAEGKYVRLVARGRWEWAERTNTSGAVVILALTSDRRMVMIEEYRRPLDARVVELPAGLVGDKPGTGEEDLIEAAKRELLEEAGCVSDRWRHLTEGPSSPGLTNERYTMYLALDARKVSDGGGDESEDIHVRLVPLDQVEQWLDEQRRGGLLVDPKVYAALYFAAKSF